MLFVMIDEGALRREVGSPEILAEQLGQVLVIAQGPKVSLQVVPASAGAHPGLSGPFVIAGFQAGSDVAYVDTALTGQLVEQQEGVCELSLLFDTLRGAALPCRTSAELIREMVITWS